jgi:peptidoglycan hydrolase CwlO-like protein
MDIVIYFLIFVFGWTVLDFLFNGINKPQKKEINRLKAEVTNMSNQINSLNNEVNNLRDELSSLKNN